MSPYISNGHGHIYIYMHVNIYMCISINVYVYPAKLTTNLGKYNKNMRCAIEAHVCIYIYMKQDMAICVSNIRGHVYSKCMATRI